MYLHTLFRCTWPRGNSSSLQQTFTGTELKYQNHKTSMISENTELHFISGAESCVLDNLCHPGKSMVCLFASVTKEKGSSAAKQQTLKHWQSCWATNTERLTPTQSFKRGCEVFLNSFHGNMAVFGAWAWACQLSRLVGNHERPAR